MHDTRIWFEKFDAEMDGGVVMFIGYSGDKVLKSAATRATARAFAEKMLRILDKADTDDECRVLPFERAG